MFFRLSRRYITPAGKLRNWGSPVFARFVSVKSHTTPNPNVKRYETFPEMVILPEAYGSSLEIKNVSQARVSPLAQLLLSFPEIRSVNMNSTSFSIAKKPSVSWEYIDSVLDEKLDKISYNDSQKSLNATFSKMMRLSSPFTNPKTFPKTQI